MKRTLSALLLFFVFNAQSQDFTWAKSISANSTTYGLNMIEDSDANIITIGRYSGLLDYEQGNTYQYIKAPNTDAIFISKYDSLGQIIWVKTLPRLQLDGYSNYYYTSGENVSKSIAVDANNNIYVVGCYTGTTDFDPSVSTAYLSTPSNVSYTFLLKLNELGQFVWVKQFDFTTNIAPNFYSCPMSVDIGSTNAIILSGSYKGVVDMNPNAGFALDTAKKANGLYGGTNSFIISMDTSGQYNWSYSFNGNNTNYTHKVLSDGNILFTGRFEDSVMNANPKEVPAHYLHNQGIDPDLFLALLDSTGNLVEAGIFNSNLSNSNNFKSKIVDIEQDSRGYIYLLLNNVNHEVNPDTNSLQPIYPLGTSAVVKVDDTLGFIWTNGIHSVPVASSSFVNATANAMSISHDYIYVGGNFHGKVYFNNTNPLTGTGSYDDVFLVKYDSTGNFVTNRRIGEWPSSNAGSRQQLHDLVTNANENVFLTGYNNGSMSLTNWNIGTNLSSNGEDLFYIKLGGDLFTVDSRHLLNGNLLLPEPKMDIDNFGNTYQLVKYKGLLGHDNQIIITDSAQTIVLTKIDSIGQIIYQRFFNFHYINHFSPEIAVSPTGAVAIFGTVFGIEDADPGLGYFPIGSNLNSKKYLIRLDQNGNFDWAQHLLGSVSNYSNLKVRIDDNENIYFTMRNAGLYTFTGVPTIDISNGQTKDRVVKLDSLGNTVKVYKFSNYFLDNEGPVDFDFDKKGGIAFACNFSTAVNPVNLGSYGSYSISTHKQGVIISLDSTDNVNWILDSVCPRTRLITFDKGNNLAYLYKLQFLHNNYIAKADTNGNWLWSHEIHGIHSNDYDYLSITTDSLANIILGGYQRHPYNLTGDIYKIDSSGNTYKFNSLALGITDIKAGLNDKLSIQGYYADTLQLSNLGNSMEGYGLQNYFVSVGDFCQKLLDTSITNCGTNLSLNSFIYSNTGVYQQAFFNINGSSCDSVLRVHFNKVQLDTNTIVANDSIISADTLSAYQWFDCDNNTIIANATNQYFVPNVTGNYAVILSQNGCMDTTDCVPVTVVGVNLVSNNGVKIYPNPTENYFTIELDRVYKNVEIVVKSISGQIVQTIKFDEFISEKLELKSTPGLYFIEINTPENKSVLKILKS